MITKYGIEDIIGQKYPNNMPAYKEVTLTVPLLTKEYSLILSSILFIELKISVQCFCISNPAGVNSTPEFFPCLP